MTVKVLSIFVAFLKNMNFKERKEEENMRRLKFRYSEKSTKFEKNLPLKIWRYWVVSNFKWKIFSNFVAFSEYPNFIKKNLRKNWGRGLLALLSFREVQLIAGLTGVPLLGDDKTSSPEFARSLGSSLESAQRWVLTRSRPVGGCL